VGRIPARAGRATAVGRLGPTGYLARELLDELPAVLAQLDR
jgi:hypothetical protein